MSPKHTRSKESKFTRGEKCIFTHLIITFVIIIALIIVYIVHLCLVKHTKNDVFKISRRSQDIQSELLEKYSIGVVYLNGTQPRMLCNTLLLKQRWSLAPAQCAAMRSDPAMSPFLLLWMILYKNSDGKYLESIIIRSLTHSHFNRDDYNSNIGLFEHQDLMSLKEYVVPYNYVLNGEIFEKYSNKLNMFNWQLNASNRGKSLKAAIYALHPVPMDRCSIVVNPVLELRSYELCTTFERIGPTLDHGALFIMNTSIVGFFSWGDLSGRGVPLIILNVIHFREWFENIISL